MSVEITQTSVTGRLNLFQMCHRFRPYCGPRAQPAWRSRASTIRRVTFLGGSDPWPYQGLGLQIVRAPSPGEPHGPFLQAESGLG